MKVLSVHERVIRGTIEQMTEIVKTYGSSNDRMHPHELWPKTQMEGPDGPPTVGRIANRGKARFVMTSYEITEKKVHYSWKFLEPAGFVGYHQADIVDIGDGKLHIKTFIKMDVRGFTFILLWLLVMRYFHHAVVEDCFDKVERQLGGTPKGHKWSLWVRILRRIKRMSSEEYQQLHREEMSRRALAK